MFCCFCPCSMTQVNDNPEPRDPPTHSDNPEPRDPPTHSDNPEPTRNSQVIPNSPPSINSPNLIESAVLTNDASTQNSNLGPSTSILHLPKPLESNDIDAMNYCGIQPNRSVSFEQAKVMVTSHSSTDPYVKTSNQRKTNSPNIDGIITLSNKNNNSEVNMPSALRFIDIDSIELYLNNCKEMIDQLSVQLRYSFLESVVKNILDFAQIRDIELSIDIKMQVLSFIESVVNENSCLGDLLLVYEQPR